MTTSVIARLVVFALVAMCLVPGCHKAPSGASAAGGCDAVPTEAAESSTIPADPGTSCDDKPIDASCPESNTTSFAKTKFVLHTGLAFGTFHHWLWKPYQEGTFKSGAHGRIMAFIKAGLAALFIKREIRLASEDVKASPALCKVIAQPLANVGNAVKDAYDRLKSGDASGITQVNSLTSLVESSSDKDGVPITEDESGNLTSVPK
jgi:hypothetical protein